MDHSAARSVMELAQATTASCCIGTFTGFSTRNIPLVDFAGNPWAPLEARTTCSDFWSVDGVNVGALIVLQFERGDPACPIVVGVLRDPPAAQKTRAVLDGQVLRLQAGRSIELVCGRSSIAMSADGRIVIKGADLVSRSSGSNKIRGATVAIN